MEGKHLQSVASGNRQRAAGRRYEERSGLATAETVSKAIQARCGHDSSPTSIDPADTQGVLILSKR